MFPVVRGFNYRRGIYRLYLKVLLFLLIHSSYTYLGGNFVQTFYVICVNLRIAVVGVWKRLMLFGWMVLDWRGCGESSNKVFVCDVNNLIGLLFWVYLG